MVVAHFAVRIAAVVILSKSKLFGFRAVAIREYFLSHPFNRQRTSELPNPKFANRQMAESSTLVRRRHFFYDHAVNLSVVGNDRHKRTVRL
jgi:hypothetical protein